ncbi:hypothetical protein [Chryseobacterium formosense]|nr:hypothetical protein [Chryseobacterium formosense]
MKRNLFLRLCLIFLVALSTYSCRTDQFPEKETFNNSSKFQLTSKRISLNESKHRSILVPELEKAKTAFKNSKSLVNGRVVDYGNGVSIDTESVIYIENGPNFHTYTFNIKKENAPADAPLENLLLVPFANGTYREFLVTYHLTPQEKENISKGYYFYSGDYTTITELTAGTFNGNGQLARLSCGWTTETIWIACSSGAHDGSNFHSCEYLTNPGGTPPSAYTISSYTCADVKDETIEQIPGPIGGGGSTGGGGECSDCPPENNTPQPCIQIPTDPTQPSSGMVDENGCAIGLPTLPNVKPQTPCGDLTIKGENTEFQSKMLELKQDANGLAEAGITMYNDNPNYGNKTFGGVDSNGNSFVKLDFDWNRAPNITGFMHCHLNIMSIPSLRTLSVFSMTDFYALAQLVENSTAPTHELGMYVTSERGTFAIKLTNKQAIIDFANYIKNNEEYVNIIFEKDIKYNMTKKQQIKGLLKLIKDSGVGAGIDLYESDANFKNWKKHYLDENDDLKTSNCI